MLVVSNVPAEGGKIYLLVPGKDPRWLNPDEWNFIQRVLPYWKDLPGSPFYDSQIQTLNSLIQPPKA